jgi:hypothetical protein
MRKYALPAAVILGIAAQCAPASASGYTIWQTTCATLGTNKCGQHRTDHISLFFTTAGAASTYINQHIIPVYPCSPTSCFNQGLEATSSECATEAASNKKAGYFYCVTPWAGAAPTPRPGQNLLNW